MIAMRAMIVLMSTVTAETTIVVNVLVLCIVVVILLQSRDHASSITYMSHTRNTSNTSIKRALPRAQHLVSFPCHWSEPSHQSLAHSQTGRKD